MRVISMQQASAAVRSLFARITQVGGDSMMSGLQFDCGYVDNWALCTFVCKPHMWVGETRARGESVTLNGSARFLRPGRRSR